MNPTPPPGGPKGPPPNQGSSVRSPNGSPNGSPNQGSSVHHLSTPLSDHLAQELIAQLRGYRAVAPIKMSGDAIRVQIDVEGARAGWNQMLDSRVAAMTEMFEAALEQAIADIPNRIAALAKAEVARQVQDLLTAVTRRSLEKHRADLQNAAESAVMHKMAEITRRAEE